MRLTIALVLISALAGAASAQQTPPPAPPGNPPVGKIDCRAQAQAQGLGGQAARDATQLCVAELRVACLKQAIAQKMVGPARRDFMKSCAGRPGPGDDDKKG